MKKICFITTVPITLEQFVLENAKYLHEQKGYDITFICDYDEKFQKKLPSYINYIPISMKRGVDFKAINIIRKLYVIFKRNQFDIIQYSTPNASFYASLAGYLSNSKVRLYAQWGIRYVGFYGYKRKIFKIMEKFTCYFSTHIRAVSRKNCEFGIAEKLYLPEKVKVIGEGGTIGVDLNFFDIKQKTIYQAELKTKFNIKKEFVYGYIGRLSADKGINELLMAFKEITEKNNNVKLIIVGPEEKKSQINMIDWAKKNKSIIFVGHVNHNELIKYYSLFDCYVHPSYREGFGMVLQEAAAMELPIITTNVPGASEVMEVNKSCLLVEKQNYKELKKQMIRIYEDEVLRVQLSKNARERVEEYFEREKMLKNIYNDYEVL